MELKIFDMELKSSDICMETFFFTKKILDKISCVAEDKAINIRELAKKYNIDIVEKKFIRKNNIFEYEVQGYLDYYDFEPGNYKWTIYVNEEMGDLTKRYTIAHELGHYFLKTESTKYCNNPLFPKTSEEQLCDLIASYLLLPIETVFVVMQEYIEKCRKRRRDISINLYDWLEYLGATMGVSLYHTIICFQNVRHLGGILYENISNNQVNNKYKPMIEELAPVLREYSHLFR